MSIDREPVTKLGVLIPDGEHIFGPIMGLLERRGIHIREMRRNGALHLDVDNAPVALTVRPSSRAIAEVEEGRLFQVGFAGSERRAEYIASLPENTTPRVEEVARFESVFSPSLRLSILVRNNPVDAVRFRGITDLRGRTMVTRYPGLARQFLRPYFPEEERVPVRIESKRVGKEEGLVAGHVADATLVLVESGGTMRENKLRELEEGVAMRDIQPVAIANLKAIRERGGELLLEQFVDRLQNGRRQSRILDAIFGVSQLLTLSRLLKSL